MSNQRSFDLMILWVAADEHKRMCADIRKCFTTCGIEKENSTGR